MIQRTDCPRPLAAEPRTASRRTAIRSIGKKQYVLASDRDYGLYIFDV